MRVALSTMTGVLMRDRRGETQTQRRSHVEMEAETSRTWPHAQGHLEPPEDGKGRKEPPLEPVEGAPPCPTWTSDIWSPELGEDGFWLFYDTQLCQIRLWEL